ncbi:MAG: hypothetical protein ACFHU9_06880 [Fluviicola sp.]
MQPEAIHNNRVLLSPLNWGMGHVSRSIGLVDQLLKQGNDLILACDAEQSSIYKIYFPSVTYVLHEGYPFKFQGKGNFAWDLTRNMRSLRSRLQLEMAETKRLVEKFHIDVVLSDHRYGFFDEVVPSIFITHQYHLPVPRLQSIADRWHKKHMQPFSDIWILDYSDSRLSGRLSADTRDDRVVYIGPYSRFSSYKTSGEKHLENIIVASGPKVYAQQFVDEMVRKHPNAVLICSNDIHVPTSIKTISNNWKEQDQAILGAKRLISRSGYSTVMDLEFLKIPALLYPTPGQTEQIYLHDRLTDCSEYIP